MLNRNMFKELVITEHVQVVGHVSKSNNHPNTSNYHSNKNNNNHNNINNNNNNNIDIQNKNQM